MTQLTRARIAITVMAISHVATSAFMLKAFNNLMHAYEKRGRLLDALIASSNKHIPPEYLREVREDISFFVISENYGELVFPPIPQE